jgi:hypothetical protein
MNTVEAPSPARSRGRPAATQEVMMRRIIGSLSAVLLVLLVLAMLAGPAAAATAIEYGLISS